MTISTILRAGTVTALAFLFSFCVSCKPNPPLQTASNFSFNTGVILSGGTTTVKCTSIGCQASTDTSGVSGGIHLVVQGTIGTDSLGNTFAKFTTTLAP